MWFWIFFYGAHINHIYLVHVPSVSTLYDYVLFSDMMYECIWRRFQIIQSCQNLSEFYHIYMYIVGGAVGYMYLYGLLGCGVCSSEIAIGCL